MSSTEERKVEPMAPHALQSAEHKRNCWSVTVPKATLPTDLLDPTFWAHHGGKLAPYDKIEVRVEDGSWYQEMIVMDSSRAWVRVKPIIEVVRFTSADVSQTQADAANGYQVMHRGPRGWSVVRNKDRAIMFEEGKIRDDAESWIKANAEALKSGALEPVKT